MGTPEQIKAMDIRTVEVGPKYQQHREQYQEKHKQVAGLARLRNRKRGQAKKLSDQIEELK